MPNEIQQETKYIDASGAVKAAYEYLLKVSPTPDRFSNFRVEELRQDENKDFMVTLSYDFTGDVPFDRKREYKDFKVLKDGTVDSMQIRTL